MDDNARAHVKSTKRAIEKLTRPQFLGRAKEIADLLSAATKGLHLLYPDLSMARHAHVVVLEGLMVEGAATTPARNQLKALATTRLKEVLADAKAEALARAP
jgi:hypothetical protein